MRLCPRMTPDDAQYLARIARSGLLAAPCLELGTGYGGPTAASLLATMGIETTGTDVHPGPGVDLVIDFEASTEEVKDSARGRRFASALIVNVLEHTFQPIVVLDNLVSLIVPGGVIVAVAPAVWPLHSYPHDCYRLLPDFYVRYASTRGLRLELGTFEYLGYGPVIPGPTSTMPRPGRSKIRDLYSRFVHRLFNTTGRGMFFPSHLLIGVVLRTPNG